MILGLLQKKKERDRATSISILKDPSVRPRPPPGQSEGVPTDVHSIKGPVCLQHSEPLYARHVVLIFQPEQQINIKEGVQQFPHSNLCPRRGGGEATFGLPHLGCFAPLFTLQSGHLGGEGQRPRRGQSVSGTAERSSAGLYIPPDTRLRSVTGGKLRGGSKFVLVMRTNSEV